MPNAPTIELPRHPDESARAYAARVEYVTMGAGRSLEKVRGHSGGKAGIPQRLNTLAEWSARYGWVESAAQYDREIALLTVQEAAEQHRADIADYRKRYGEMGRAMLSTAAKMLTKLNQSVATMEVGPGSLALIANATKTAADLEALALRIEQMLGDDERSSEQ